jgi:transposase
MPAQRMTMRKTREIIRLRLGKNLSQQQVAQNCNCSQSTVHDCMARVKLAGLSWPLPEELDDEKLQQMLYPKSLAASHKPEPDYKQVHLEFAKKGVTLELLWQEYRQQYPEGYGYSQFCDLYGKWRSKLDISMRQTHVPGEKLFVDFAGQTVEIIDPETGEVRPCPVFVAAMGFSSFTYAEVTESQDKDDWIKAHENACDFLGGVPRVWVPDNLKSGVKKPCFYDPEINPSYQELADHYDAVVLPARVRKPKDKAKVENAVLQVERWVIAPLRKQSFFSIAEANQAVRERLDWLNARKLSMLDESRRTLFEKFDKAKLKPLPQRPFQRSDWKLRVSVNIDYHIVFDFHYYSVPCQLIREKVDVRATLFTLECFHNGRRVASHVRSYIKGGFTTLDAHRPVSHRQYAGWTPERMLNWASTVGPITAQTVGAIMQNKRHPEQGYRAAMGVIRLADRYGKQRVEQACQRAHELKSHSYRTIESILKNSLEQQVLPNTPSTQYPSIEHENIRGEEYYN